MVKMPLLLLLGFLVAAASSHCESLGNDFDLTSRHEVQANSFTSSSQDAPTIAGHPAGGFTVAWHSRRQQAGTYGVYLQRFSQTGKAVGTETQVNVFTKCMQRNPAIATDAQGNTWVAWESFGQDGSFNAIVARRFSGKEFSGSDEILVNQFTTGNQSEVVAACGDENSITFFWVTQNMAGTKKHIAARNFDLSGRPIGDEFVVAPSPNHQSLPTVASCNGKMVLAWAEQDEFGRPAGLFGKVTTPGNTNYAPSFRIAPKDKSMQIEPTVCVLSNGEIAVAWLRQAGKEYDVSVRKFDCHGTALGSDSQVSVPGAKYVSGAAIEAIDNEQFIVCWNQQTDNVGKDRNIFAQAFDKDGETIGAIFPINKQREGKHLLTAASGKRRVLWDNDSGSLRVVWSGQNEVDESSVNVTAFIPGATTFVFSTPNTHAETEPESTARPHDPPVYDPKLVAKEPFGGFKTLGPPGTDFGFVAINATGWNPPDASLAVGPNHLVAMTNGAIAFFDKSGNLTFSDQIEGGAGFWGNQGATGFVFDPETLFDPHSQRFFAMANERGGGRSYFLLAVSDNDNPNGNWFKYRFDVTDLADDNIDSPNIGIDSESVYLTADFFGPDRYLVYMLRKSDLLVGNPPQTTNLLINGSQSYGIPLIYDSMAPAFYMIQAFEFGNFSSVRFHAITDALTNPQRVTTDVSVPAYGHPQDPPQQGTSVRPELFEARFWSCVYRDGSLWAVHHHSPNSSGTVRARWYEFAMNGWPTSGQLPTLVQSGELTPNNNAGQQSATFFPSIWVDELGNAAITTARSSTSEFISMSRAVRAASDAPNTFQDIQLVQPSTSIFTSGGRWGDYSGTSSDPSEPGSLWGMHEFAQSNGIWQTFIAKYVVGTPGTNIFPTSVSADPGSIINGTFVDLEQSDDSYLTILAEPRDAKESQEISVTLTGNTVNTEFGSLAFVLESSLNTPNITQTVELFNFVDGEFELLDTRAGELVDTIAELNVPGDVSRFVTPGSGLLIARVNFSSNGPTLFFPWQARLDEARWQLSD